MRLYLEESNLWKPSEWFQYLAQKGFPISRDRVETSCGALGFYGPSTRSHTHHGAKVDPSERFSLPGGPQEVTE